MKIVHIQDVFHPEAGYQENVLAKYNSHDGHDVIVVCADMKKIPDYIVSFFGKDDIEKIDGEFEEETGVKIRRFPLHAYISGRAIYKGRVFNEILKMRPDILFIHGNDTYIGMRYILKLHKLPFPVIYDNHMVEVAAHNKFRMFYYFLYRKIFAKEIQKNAVTVIRTENDDFVQKRLGIPKELSPVIQFGSDMYLFKRDFLQRNYFRDEVGIRHNVFLVIYAGKLDEYKGGMFLAKALKERIVVPDKNVEFMIVGNCVGEYGKSVEKVFNESENKIYRFPTQKYMQLPQFWQSADCMVMPKECSTTFFDAQACGLPCIAENSIQINKERLSHGNGYCYNSNDIRDFRKKIVDIAMLDADEYALMSQNAINYVEKNYNYRRIVDDIYIEVERQIKTWERRKDECIDN